MEVRNLCLRIPCKRHGVSLLGSTANAQHCMHVGLGQPAEAPTQTVEKVEKALATLQDVGRSACNQHDHVSFAKAWMLMSREVAHALDFDFRLVPPAVMASLQRRIEGGLRQTLSVLLGSVGLGASGTLYVLRRLGHQGCSDGFCGTGNVLVGC